MTARKVQEETEDWSGMIGARALAISDRLKLKASNVCLLVVVGQ